MKNLEHVCYNTRFSHIYVERRIRNHPRTEQILLRFPQAQIVEIEHYKDVFNRHGQDCVRQHQAQALILAEKTDHFFYEGAPVCQDFGNTNFYYCSTMMNCIYDCSYCYLKGMYPSGHMVLFVNIEDYLEELDHILKTQNMYVCISYDADLLYIRLTYLMNDLLNAVDRDVIGLQVGVELSYLTVPEQEMVEEVHESTGKYPSLEQAKKIRQHREEKTLTKEIVRLLVIGERKKKTTVTLKQDEIKKYFPPEYDEQKIRTVICQLLEEWSNQNH